MSFGFLTAGVMLGEMLPVRIPRRGNDELMTLSTCFSVALLLVGGLVPAVLAQGLASVLTHGMYADTRHYVRDVLALQSRFGG